MGGGIGGLADDLRPRFSPAGESPAARQIRLAEMDEEDNPTVVVEQEKPLPQAQSDPCPSCGVCSDLRSKFTDVRGWRSTARESLISDGFAGADRNDTPTGGCCRRISPNAVTMNRKCWTSSQAISRSRSRIERDRRRAVFMTPG